VQHAPEIEPQQLDRCCLVEPEPLSVERGEPRDGGERRQGGERP
jgi:hypothetical protein